MLIGHELITNAIKGMNLLKEWMPENLVMYETMPWLVIEMYGCGKDMYHTIIQ
jgi:hypothetical protein